MHDSSPLPAGSTTISPPRVLCSSQRNSSVSSGRKIVDINNKVSGVIFLKSWKNLEDFNMEGATWYRERVNYRDGRDPRDILKSTDLRVGRIYWRNETMFALGFVDNFWIDYEIIPYLIFKWNRWIFWWDRKIESRITLINHLLFGGRDIEIFVRSSFRVKKGREKKWSINPVIHGW